MLWPQLKYYKHCFSVCVCFSVPHLGAYLHFLTDFAHTQPADEYTLVTYEVHIRANESVPHLY